MDNISCNDVHIKGKIFLIDKTKHYTDIYISSGRTLRGKPIVKQSGKNKGQFLRDLLQIRFSEGHPQRMTSNYKVGDMVSVAAFAQTIIDPLTNRTKKTMLFGYVIMPMQKKDKDMNAFAVTGKIVSAAAVSANYLIINLKAPDTKRIKNTNEDSETSYFTKKINGTVTIGLRTNGNAKNLYYATYTPGTWVAFNGHVQGRTNKSGKQEIRLIATKHEIIGAVQPWNLR